METQSVKHKKRTRTVTAIAITAEGIDQNSVESELLPYLNKGWDILKELKNTKEVIRISFTLSDARTNVQTIIDAL